MGGLPTELQVLSWSVTLLFVHLLAQGLTAIRDQGLAYNAGPRDEARPLGIVAGRARRALSNYLETYPAFVALALGLAVAGRTGGLGEVGAVLWIASRVVFLLLYVAGVPWLRTLAFAASLIGLVLMGARLA